MNLPWFIIQNEPPLEPPSDYEKPDVYYEEEDGLLVRRTILTEERDE